MLVNQERHCLLTRPNHLLETRSGWCVFFLTSARCVMAEYVLFFYEIQAFTYMWFEHKYGMLSIHSVRLTQYTSKSSRVTKCTQFFCNASRTCPMWSPILCLIHSNHFGCMMHKLSKFYLWTFFNYSPEHSLVVCMPRKRLTPRHVQGVPFSLAKNITNCVLCGLNKQHLATGF